MKIKGMPILPTIFFDAINFQKILICFQKCKSVLQAYIEATISPYGYLLFDPGSEVNDSMQFKKKYFQGK